jgi:cell division inhibitor SulA
MQIEVDQDGLALLASTLDTVAEHVAAVRLTELASAVSTAMPGSRSAVVAAVAAARCGEAVSALVRGLDGHADALRNAGQRYDDTERNLAAAAVTA